MLSSRSYRSYFVVPFIYCSISNFQGKNMVHYSSYKTAQLQGYGDKRSVAHILCAKFRF